MVQLVVVCQSMVCVKDVMRTEVTTNKTKPMVRDFKFFETGSNVIPQPRLPRTPIAHIPVPPFTDSVHAASGEMDLKSEVLVAVADAPKGKEGDGSTVGGGTIDSIRQLIATDQVEIQQGGHVLKAGHAEFRLREQAAEFTGNPEILAASGAYLSGATIRSQEGLVFVTGNADDGRAQLIVSQAQGLGILGAQIESAETIVLADSITMRELDTGN